MLTHNIPMIADIFSLMSKSSVFKIDTKMELISQSSLSRLLSITDFSTILEIILSLWLEKEKKT